MVRADLFRTGCFRNSRFYKINFVLSLSACSLSFQAACSGGRRLVSTDHSLLSFDTPPMPRENIAPSGALHPDKMETPLATRELLKDNHRETDRRYSSGRYPAGSLLPRDSSSKVKAYFMSYARVVTPAKIERLWTHPATPHVGTRVEVVEKVQTLIRKLPRSPI